MRDLTYGSPVAVFGVMLLASLFAQYEPALQFQSRGDRFEGLRTIPVGGLEVELLSARVDTLSATNVPNTSTGARTWSERIGLRFYLPEKNDVFVTVRQLRSGSTYYWLNQVKGAWRPAALNEYTWPTTDVLRRLTNVRFQDLGVAVRLGRDEPRAKRETVLPAALFDDNHPDTVTTYRFSLKTNGRAKVNTAIYRGHAELHRRPTNWEQAGSPFTILWDARSAPEGWYRLVLSGYFEDNTPLDKEVVFYHHRQLMDLPPRGQDP